MQNRFTKVVVDIIKVYFIRWEGDTFIAALVGAFCAMFFAVHLYRNRGWLASAADELFRKKSSKRTKFLHTVDILSIVAWTISGISGFLLAIAHTGEIDGLLMFARIYAISTRTAAYLVIIHIIKHLIQFLFYMKFKLQHQKE